MTEDSRPDKSGGDDRDRKFGPTEVRIAPISSEILTPTQKLIGVLIGTLAIVVGVMGLLGISIRPRDGE